MNEVNAYNYKIILTIKYPVYCLKYEKNGYTKNRKSYSNYRVKGFVFF